MRRAMFAAVVSSLFLSFTCTERDVGERIDSTTCCDAMKRVQAENATLEQQVIDLKLDAQSEGRFPEALAGIIRNAEKLLAEAENEVPKLLMAAHELEYEESESTDPAEKLLGGITALKSRIADSHQVIERQRRQLSSNRALHATLEARQRELRAKSEQIEELEKSLKSAVDDAIQAQLKADKWKQQSEEERIQRQSLKDQNDELQQVLYTGYYVVMPEDDLVLAGILKKNRVWFRQAFRLAELPVSKFETLDIRQQGMIPLKYPRDRVRIVSQHPRSSYKTVSTGEAESAVHIVDREAFWSNRFLIVAIRR